MCIWAHADANVEKVLAASETKAIVQRLANLVSS